MVAKVRQANTDRILELRLPHTREQRAKKLPIDTEQTLYSRVHIISAQGRQFWF